MPKLYDNLVAEWGLFKKVTQAPKSQKPEARSQKPEARSQKPG